ncbi:MAG: 23S rRNA (adenine(2503)-C(2))-methyltransferase RlmN [Alphaproteobacteria bacterium]|jgi:23S rRNA (adenine2503-C2)-methyltransferase|nr:23S rRNA (adenine(2503)-C(2))-methyltransferase RlmN [Rhodospirillaceae bacterium]MDP6406435.1 23S rRNA (adenine(2503)-C(2))-methyltransferase RlmN [Alphaproteobacteria bacterium]MDP6621867.1 23S rRNA (adenine(2503)-C(2))-methyltransferase RlmN [Alphaproteobacteria bacterium]|tara:strand:+ start:371 stop:1501 length:1131 start_codon:yes stop_codon:yes gene_type:complete
MSDAAIEHHSSHLPGELDLAGLTRPELAVALTGLGVPERSLSMRTSQLWHWLYHRGVTDLEAMSNVSKEMRTRLAGAARIGRPRLVTSQASADGTQKWLLELADGARVESVYIPQESRGTLCISSQVGCTLNCRFCHTGTQPLVRNLTAAEIVGQVLLARDQLGEWPTPTLERRLISNVVVMGMGEPLYNYDNVAQALAVIMDGDGISISRRRMTLSTAGVVPAMDRAGRELGVLLAVSLHAVSDDLRDELVPLNRKYPIKDLLAACRRYPGSSNARRITFEYVMLKGLNDSPADARALTRLIAGIPAKINLIPFNPWPGAPYECPDWPVIERFGEIVNRAGYASPIRLPRGRDIMAACGQLKSASQRAGRRPRPA